MKLDEIFLEVGSFNEQTHGRSDYYKDAFFIKSPEDGAYAPLRFVQKNFSEIDENDLIAMGLIYESHDVGGGDFADWFEKQFSRKVTGPILRRSTILALPNNKAIFDAVEQINKCYEVLRSEKILINNKKMPVQIGEWYAKCIFGLEQRKSSSQRGFDFYHQDRRVEVKIHWGDQSSPKGVKVRKSQLELSEYCIVLYVSRNLRIREVCFLDSDFIQRKFSGKGHTVFLKDSDISQYFFSKSSKHDRKVSNKTSLLKFSSPVLAMNLADRFQ